MKKGRRKGEGGCFYFLVSIKQFFVLYCIVFEHLYSTSHSIKPYRSAFKSRLGMSIPKLWTVYIVHNAVVLCENKYM